MVDSFTDRSSASNAPNLRDQSAFVHVIGPPEPLLEQNHGREDNFV
jgi:hypothetical protein